MSVLESIILGFLQGLAEFLPISSSGHLQLAQSLFGLEEVPLLFDVFLHLATLLAVCLYFWPKIWNLLKCFGRWIIRDNSKLQTSSNLEPQDCLCQNDYVGRKAIIAIIISTIITAIIGILTSKFIPQMSNKIICIGFIITSLLLISSSIISIKNNLQNQETLQKGISIKQAIIIGLMQGVGTLPGISRSGSTISASLFSKLDQKTAGDYSFIISIPAILGAFILELKDLKDVTSSIGVLPIIVGCITAFVVGYISLSILMKLLRKGKLAWFSAYLIPVAILGLLFL